MNRLSAALIIIISIFFSACQQHTEQTLKIGISPWPGYEPLALATEQEFYDKTQVRIIRFATPTESYKALRDRIIGVAAFTADEVFYFNNSKDALIENRIDGRMIMITGKQKREQFVFKITDNAGGIPEEIIDRIFEPYYTTKEEGKGTGIGLYMSKMIIEENMRGLIQVQNSDIGAEFTIIFNNIKRQ